MSLHDIGARFVEMCNDRKNFDVMETMYDPDIVSVEPTGKQTKGQAEVIAKSKRWAEVNTIHGETVRGPYFSGDDQFAVQITFEVTRNDTGKRETLEEIGVYTVRNDLIVREQFYFGGDRW